MKRYESKDEALDGVAQFVAESIETVLHKKEYCVLALPGGRSAAAVCEKLVCLDVDWSRVHIFMVDERLVPISDDESNFKIVKEHLVDKMNGQIPKSQVHPFVYDSSLEDEGVANYTDQLDSLGGAFDVLFVSAGEDAHIAALPPNHSVLDTKELFVTLHDSPKPPADRMTSSVSLIKSTEYIALLFAGLGKRAALSSYLDPTVTYRACPAKICNEAKHCEVFTDLK